MNARKTTPGDTFGVTYTLAAHPQGLTKADLLARRAGGTNEGACDGVVLFHLVYRDSGATSSSMTSLGADGRPLPASESFKCWAILASHLEADPSVSEEDRAIARAAFDAVKVRLKRTDA